MKFLIVGCGPAGIAAARAVKERNNDAEITIVTEEREMPYIRSLLPSLLSGEIEEDSLSDPKGQDLQVMGIELLQGMKVNHIDGKKRTVYFKDSTTRKYDSLLIATGGKPRIPDSLRGGSKWVIPFDSLSDTRRIRERAEKSKSVVVYGYGYLGIVTCMALRKKGLNVIWFRPDLTRYGEPIYGELEARYIDDLRNNDVEIRDDADVDGVREGDDKTVLIHGTSGDEISCSMVVVATERSPSIGFLSDSGVSTRTGVVVDDYLMTTVPDIYAAGDCAELMDRKSGRVYINFGWRSAIMQGKLAGENMAGREKRLIQNRTNYFWQIIRPPQG